MEIGPFNGESLDLFLALARAEGWISDPWELTFLQRAFPGGCLAATLAGRPVGFVTAVRHGTGGWVGNLLVEREFRGRGIGARLMERAMEELIAAGTETVWLTASPAGRPLYERMGFRELDTVTRWVGAGAPGEASAGVMPLEGMVALDRQGWDDRREALLAAVAERGTLLAGDGGFLVVQPCGDGVQIGPWCGGNGCATALLAGARAVAGSAGRVVLDTPARNVSAAALLNAAGFSVAGRTSLMCVGRSPAYDPSTLFSLASLGSMG